MKKIIFGLLLGLFLTGCQQPTIDYNNFSDIDPSRPEVEVEQETAEDEQQEEIIEEEIIEEEIIEDKQVEETPTVDNVEEEVKEPEIDYSDRTIQGVEDDSEYEIVYITELLTHPSDFDEKFEQYISFGESAGFLKNNKGVLTHRNPYIELSNEFFKMVDLESEYKDALYRWENDWFNEEKLIKANKLLIELCNRARYMFYEISDMRGDSYERVYEKTTF